MSFLKDFLHIKILFEDRKDRPKGWSRQQAAEEFGVTERTINNWEKNPSALSYEKIKQVASVYDIPVNYIFLGPNI